MESLTSERSPNDLNIQANYVKRYELLGQCKKRLINL
jgi:hypothetical protein